MVKKAAKKAAKKVAKKTAAKKAAPKKKAASKKAAAPAAPAAPAVDAPAPVLNVHGIARALAAANTAPPIPAGQFGGVCYVPNVIGGTPHPEVTRDQCDLIGEWVETPQTPVLDAQSIARAFAQANAAPAIAADQLGTCWIPRRLGGTPYPCDNQDKCERLLGGEWEGN